MITVRARVKGAFEGFLMIIQDHDRMCAGIFFFSAVRQIVYFKGILSVSPRLRGRL